MIKNFDKLSFERKVDVLVGIHVMGWTDLKIYNEIYIANKGGVSLPCYSTLLTSAWNIVRKFNHVEIIKNKHNNGTLWQCKVGEVGVIQEYSVSETEQLAICYAGLKAVEMGEYLKLFLKEEKKS
jgi:Phage ABA sandwich domain